MCKICDEIQAERAEVADRAKRLQASLDHVNAVDADALGATGAYYLRGLKASLNGSLRAVSNRAKALDVDIRWPEHAE